MYVLKIIMVIGGRALFWFGWPALFVYLYYSRRTRVIIVCDDSILLGKGFLGSGEWVLPGGGLHWREKPESGAVREVFEETGITVHESALRYLGVHRTKRGLRFTYELFYVELAERPPIRPQRFEIADLRWIDVQEVNHLEPATEEALVIWRSPGHLVH